MSRKCYALAACWMIAIATGICDPGQANQMSNARATSPNQSTAVEAATRLYGHFVGNVALKCSYHSDYLHNGKSIRHEEGPILLASWDGSFLVNNGTYYTSLRQSTEGYPPDKIWMNQQLLIKPGGSCIATSYDLSGNTITKINNSISNKTPEEAMSSFFVYANLRELFGKGFFMRKTLQQVCEDPNIKEVIFDNRLEARLTTEYGDFLFRANYINGHAHINELIITCKGDHLVSPGADQRYRDIKHTWPNYEHNGIDQVEKLFRFDYTHGQSDVRLERYRLNDKLVAGDQTWEWVNVLTINERIHLRSAADFDRYMIKLEEGEPVQSSDPALKNVELAYQGGEIVRKVDGAPLAQVEVEVAQARRMRWIVGSAVAVLVMATLGWWLWQRRRSTRTT